MKGLPPRGHLGRGVLRRASVTAFRGHVLRKLCDGTCMREDGVGDKDRVCSVWRVKSLSSYSIYVSQHRPFTGESVAYLSFRVPERQVCGRIWRGMWMWLVREGPLVDSLVTWNEDRHQREPLPTETDTVPAGTPTPGSVVFKTAPGGSSCDPTLPTRHLRLRMCL